jgi:hypothetical protein
MNLFRIVIAAALSSLLLAGCASVPRVYSSADPQADFSAYRSFGFVERAGTDRGEYTSLLTVQLQDATRRTLQARGYVHDAANPDLLVNFNVSTRTRIESRPGPAMGWGGYYPYRWGHYGPWPGWAHEPVRAYEEGTLNIDLVDAAQRRLVWEGMAVTRLRHDAHGHSDEAVHQAVAAIFARYPYTARR